MSEKILITRSGNDYELLDSGEGEKLERFGDVVMSRPDPQALWPKRLEKAKWDKAQARFEQKGEKASWKIDSEVPERWQISLGGLKLVMRPSSFKHIGVFPEQEQNWLWLREKIKKENEARATTGNSEKVSVLNLFGYTGGATLAAATEGAKVTHVDASKASIVWAKENAEASGLSDAPIRWMLDDCKKFIQKELRRGSRYDIIILDPPSFGHGPKGELWKIEDELVNFLGLCFELFSMQPVALLLNGYSAGYSAIAYKNNILPLVEKCGGIVEEGELAIQESGSQGRLLPAGIFARWSRLEND
jgi:23S rRNA (cytosine1962-C5)-methyltransferase